MTSDDPATAGAQESVVGSADGAGALEANPVAAPEQAPVTEAAPAEPAVQVASEPTPSEDPAAGGTDLIEAMFELETQLDQMVISGTKMAQRVTQVPAVITVISADELQARGYSSLAEALRTVPGFYDVFDLATHNVGIRGINGGARASGSVLKLMIDGQPVAFRPSTGNFFGEELIPLQAIERIEVIRGPGSALYGANAFLGVINVITKSGKDYQGTRVTGYGSMVRANPGGGGGLMLSAGDDRGEVLVAASGMYLDRSGLSLPESSPLIERGLDNPDDSSGDVARPKTLFAKASWGNAEDAGRVSAMASVQNLEAGGEFQDYAPLTHQTRLSLVNQSYRLAYDRDFDRFKLRLTGSYFYSQPSDRERIDLGTPGSLLLRNVSAQGTEFSAEAQYQPIDQLSLSGGVDFQHEDHVLQTYDTLLTQDVLAYDGSVLRRAGTVIPGEGQGERVAFDNLGAFVQGIWQMTDSLGLTGGLRLDVNSIYGQAYSPRAAAVWAPPDENYSIKLLFGSSFKAPSAEQLYTRPMQPFDIRGNDALGVQRAYTIELAGAHSFVGRAEASFTAYATRVADRVAYVQRGLYLSAQNLLDEWYAGCEAEGRYQILAPLSARLGVGFSKLVSQEQNATVLVTGSPESVQPLFPVLQAHLIVDWKLPFWGLRVSPEISYVGEREASQSNAMLLDTYYTLPAYLYTALAVSMPERKLFGERPTSVSLRASNLLGTLRAEPGFSGVDVPAQGPTVFLTLTQGL